MEETLTKPLCFLLVDDDNDDQDFFKEMLEEVNPDTNLLIANDGIEALTLLHRSTVLPDLIFLDLNMPRMGGKECLRRIKADKNLSDIPVVVYTTSAAPPDIEETRKEGVAGYIVKPTDVTALKNMLHTFTSSSNRRIEELIQPFSL